jgi:hypothetical protein
MKDSREISGFCRFLSGRVVFSAEELACFSGFA